MYDTTPGQAARRPFRGGRIAAIVAAGFVTLLSLGFLTVGGLLLWGDSQKDADGYISTPPTASTRRPPRWRPRISTSTSAAHLVAGRHRYVREGQAARRVAGRQAGLHRHRPHERCRALPARHCPRARHRHRYVALSRRLQPQAAIARSRRPAEQDIWAAPPHGDGRQTLTWDVEDGDWSVVVMNADGSPGVHAGQRRGRPQLA